MTNKWVFPGCIQITASLLALGANDISCAPFKHRVYVSCVAPTLLYSSPAETYWRLVFSVQDPQAGELNVVLRPLTLWEEPLQL